MFVDVYYAVKWGTNCPSKCYSSCVITRKQCSLLLGFYVNCLIRTCVNLHGEHRTGKLHLFCCPKVRCFIFTAFLKFFLEIYVTNKRAQCNRNF